MLPRSYMLLSQIIKKMQKDFLCTSTHFTGINEVGLTIHVKIFASDYAKFLTGKFHLS